MLAFLILLLPSGGAMGQQSLRGGASPDVGASGEQLYRRACASCHGADGTGAAASQVAFDVPLPDFTRCDFASREPDVDWAAVAHEGGPARGFARTMPAFADALGTEEVEQVIDYVRGFCGDDSWPRGELNLPRPFVTEKAYPEDEAVLTTAAAAEGPGAVTGEVTYEKRFGARSQLEVVVPFSFQETDAGDAAGDWDAGLGDIALGWKREVFHSLASGTIVSLAGEVILPTGDESAGFGKGFVAFEPFLSVGQLLPAGAFVHLQGGVELPTRGGEEEGFWRAAVGASLRQGRWGRVWSPMVEVLGTTKLDTGGTTWDLLPQLQFTLNRRQHIMANLGVRVPLETSGARPTQLLFYILWDYFDGGLFAGW